MTRIPRDGDGGDLGVVRRWSDEDGWGVIESPAVPGPVWTHHSVVRMARFRTLTPGDEVVLTWERFAQDGYGFRATSVHRPGERPAPDAADERSGAMRSSLRITRDDSSAGG